jgi:hypothetical protein
MLENSYAKVSNVVDRRPIARSLRKEFLSLSSIYYSTQKFLFFRDTPEMRNRQESDLLSKQNNVLVYQTMREQRRRAWR